MLLLFLLFTSTRHGCLSSHTGGEHVQNGRYKLVEGGRGAMASKNAEKPGRLSRMWSWFGMCCRAPKEGERGLMNGGPQKPNSDGASDAEPARTTAEDGGMDNGVFSLSEEEEEEEHLTRSASSVSECVRYVQRKKLKQLSSLPTILQPELAVTFISGDGSEEDLLFDDDTQAPSINLIPATPSDLAEDDQFFDVTLEDIEAVVCDSDANESCQEEEGGGDAAEELEEEEEVVLETKEEEKPKPRLLRSGYLVTQLPEFTQLSEC